jgi:methionine synthase II (cobalamin-independent)
VFATLLGSLPDPPADAEVLRAVIDVQVASGLEPLTDGRAAATPGDDVVARWRATAALTDHAVKQRLRGPWSAVIAGRDLPAAATREREVMAAAERLREQVLALAGAGCPLVEIEETEAHRIGEDEASRRAFLDAHLLVARDVPGTHLSLSIVGGSAWEAGSATILDPPYRSLAVDLIAGPDNWRLVAVTPGDRGIICGALEPGARRNEGPELLVWAAQYAASTRGRGLARVGLGTAGSLAHLGWEEATLKLRALGEAARVAGLPRGELADALDPRAVSSRAAATGRTRHRGQRPAE